MADRRHRTPPLPPPGLGISETGERVDAQDITAERIVDLLDRIRGAFARARRGLREAESPETIPLNEFSGDEPKRPRLSNLA
jgi:hypothetical protein